MGNIVEKVRRELIANSDEATRNSGKRYFKEEIELYGIKSATVQKIAKDNYKEIAKNGKAEIFNYCEEFWKSNMLEESFVACNWSFAQRKNYTIDDFEIFKNWINTYVNNWASCDTFCNHNIGTLVEKYPEFVHELKRWAKSENRWMRRAAAVSLIVPGKKGAFLEDIFEIADILLTDTDDMVRKGYGWMLKVASAKHEIEVFDYIMENKELMPRTSLRYAIEKMSVELKKKAMAK